MPAEHAGWTAWSRRLRKAPALSWMGYRAAFAVGMPALSLVALATSVYIPRLVPPAEFGTYALLLNLFRYAGRSDLGLSQLADRMLAVDLRQSESSRLLRLRNRLGILTLLVATPLSALLGTAFGLSPLDAALAVAAGVLAMMCGGPSSVFRAKGQIWEYTALAYMFSLGFIVPRLVGFRIGGVTGCFALLALWYGGVAAAFAAREVRATDGEPDMPVLGTLATCLPMFAFAGAWIAFLSFGRWMAAALSSPTDLGLFALGSNLALTGVTTFAQISEVRYPMMMAGLAAAPPFSTSRAVERESLTIAALVSAAACAFALIAHALTAVAFPQYEGAAPAAAAMVAGCAPLAAVGWFLPLAIAATRTPFRDAVKTFALPTLVTAAAMAYGARWGIVGQAWGFTVGAAILPACFAATLHGAALLRAGAAARLSLAACLAVLPAAGVCLAQSRVERFDDAKPASAQEAPIDQGEPSAAGGTDPSVRPAPVPAGWTRIFFDNFRTFPDRDGAPEAWQTCYPWGGRTNAANHELEIYADPTPAATSPFSIVAGGGLAITARPAAGVDAKGGRHYVSGLINSSRGFTFRHGYASMRATLPAGRGLWPAFWLLPANHTASPEIDVVESLGDRNRVYYATLHWLDGRGQRVQSLTRIATAPLAQGPHDYAVLWTAKTLSWFFDGREVKSMVLAPGFDQPMYLLANLAVGGDWPGAPDASSPFPATMTIKSIEVWRDPKEPS